jgi:hypothetical protein
MKTLEKFGGEYSLGGEHRTGGDWQPGDYKGGGGSQFPYGKEEGPVGS